MCPNPGVVFPRHYAVGRVFQEGQEGIDLQRGGVSTLPPLCAHVYITSDDYWAEEHGASPAFLRRFGIYGKVGQRLQSRSRRLCPFGK